MALTNKQKKWILSKRGKLTEKKIALDLNVDEQEVKDFLNSQKSEPPKKVFYLILVLIPILFFLILELMLRIFNYGYDTSTWTHIDKTHLGLNADVPRRYFTNIKNVPNSIQDVFLEIKPENTFRVFVLGGSSAAGYPFMPMGSFSRYIRQRLELVYPKTKIEVVNLALTAVNSYTIRDLVPDALDERPDLILIYAGHNEYYGALGVGSMESLGQNRFMANLILSLNKFKTVELLRNILQSIISALSESQPDSKSTLMSRMAEKKDIAYNSDAFDAGISQLEGNMKDAVEMITDAEVPLIISTLSYNLKDLAPFISREENGYPAAKDVFNNAITALGIK